jgi:hypothetical protein
VFASWTLEDSGVGVGVGVEVLGVAGFPHAPKPNAKVASIKGINFFSQHNIPPVDY